MNFGVHSPQSRKYRSIFISDVHLGSRHCQAKLLIDFLSAHDAEKIYLIGDIIDGWRLKKSWYWPQTHADVLRILAERGRQGSDVFYLPGNHDEFARKFVGRRIRNVAVVDHVIHHMVDGRRYLVVHGDQYDLVLRKAKWLAFLGDGFYAFALTTNTWLNFARGYLGLGYWSLGAFAKRHVKSFVNLIGQYENQVSKDVRGRNLHGVICGHIHHAENRTMHGIHYVNSGDWVESCTAIVEHLDGRLEVIYWADIIRERARFVGTVAKSRYQGQTP